MRSFELKPHHLYRVAYNIDKPELRGKLVVFLQMERYGLYNRARVRLMNPDGGTDNQPDWSLWPSCLLKVSQ
jgi:hypothetical protein